MNYHIVLTVIVTLMALYWMFVGTRLALSKPGPVNGHELNVALAIVGNKVMGAIYIVGSLITLGVLLV